MLFERRKHVNTCKTHKLTQRVSIHTKVSGLHIHYINFNAAAATRDFSIAYLLQITPATFDFLLTKKKQAKLKVASRKMRFAAAKCPPRDVLRLALKAHYFATYE